MRTLIEDVERKIAEGLAELDRDEWVDGHEFFEMLAREESLLGDGPRPPRKITRGTEDGERSPTHSPVTW